MNTIFDLRKCIYGFMVAAACGASATLVSCDDDGDGQGGWRLTAGEAVGSYPGGIMSVGGRDTTVDVAVGTDSLRIASLPVDSVVAAAVGAERLGEAMASVDSVPYASAYVASVLGESSVRLGLEADSLCFDVTVGGQRRRVAMLFSEGASARYVAADSTLSLSMEVGAVTLDGDTVEGFSPIAYELSPVKKRQGGSAATE